jgi:hypothetical protein
MRKGKETKDKAAVALGRRGGQKTKEKGPEYYSRIGKLGGRPKKKKLTA